MLETDKNVGVGVPDDPMEGSDLDGLILPRSEPPPTAAGDGEDAVPYGWVYYLNF